MFNRCTMKWLPVLVAALVAGPVMAQTTYTDNFQGKKASLDWIALDDACLTAGDGTGSIPACSGITIEQGKNGSAISLPFNADESIEGQGALLLTPADKFETGAILSAFPPFPLSQGLQVTFTTYTFGGDNGGTAGNGADGIVFFMTDGTKPAPTHAGGSGGSMGYGCSNGNDDAGGMAYGYLGLGIDEFGNFLNSGDNGSSGVYNSRNAAYGTTVHGDNSYQKNVDGSIVAGGGPQYQPERIGLRGRGNTNWTWLQSQNPDYYSGSYDISDVQDACEHGRYVSSVDEDGDKHYADIEFNYDAIPGGYAVLPDSQPIANNHDDATRNPTDATDDDKVAWPITYRLTISKSGLLNLAYSYNDGAFQPVLANEDITASNGAVPASLRFGFSAGTGGSHNVHEITCFKAAPLQSNSSASANTQKGGKVTGHTQFFLASYSRYGWWGSLVADHLSVTDDGKLIISTVATWDAKCVLTGGPCASMGTNADGDPLHSIDDPQGPSERTLLTSNNLDGVALDLTKLGSVAQNAFNTPSDATDPSGADRIKWLRGDRSVEQLHEPTHGELRHRLWVLGDIINSSPTFVGAPIAGSEPTAFNDLLYTGETNPENATGAKTYNEYVTSYASRENVVYMGANDGFVHGFRAGSYEENATTGVYEYDSSTNDGHEVIGYMPHGVLLNKAVALTDPLYSHDYLVDATPVAGDVFYGGKWHTWLVGGVGSSGKEIFALDITNPESFSESNAASLVIGDWSDADLAHLGHTVGTPIIQRMHNGQWAIIFGNGLDSTQSAGVYIGLIDSTNGSVSFQFLDTGKTSDGIAYVSSVDLDGDHIADYLYAGDTLGNVWRFDVTSNAPSAWAVDSTPLFVAKNAAGSTQPITTGITILAVDTGAKTRVMLYFGTGRQIPQTGTEGKQFADGEQSFYGIWDWNMSAWNGMSALDYAALIGAQSVTRDNLLEHAVVSQTVGGTQDGIDGYRTLATDTKVCWKGDATTSSCPATDEYGWLFDFPDGTNAGNEQVVYSPAFSDGAIVVSTAVPPGTSDNQCGPGMQTGWTMAFNPKTGAGMTQSYFPGPSGGFDDGTDDATVSGVKMNAVGTPTFIQYGGKHYVVTQTVSGVPTLLPVKPPSATDPTRVSWRELVNR